MPQAIRLASAVASHCLQQVSATADTLSETLFLAITLPGPSNPHLVAAHDAAVSLGLQLRLLRGIWGRTEGPVSVSQLPDLMRGKPGWEQVRIDLSGMPAGAFLPSWRARVVMAGIALALDRLGAGGVVRLSSPGRGAVDIDLEGDAAGTWPDELRVMLANPKAAWTDIDRGRVTLSTLLLLLAREMQVPLALVAGDGGTPERLRIGRKRGIAPRCGP